RTYTYGRLVARRKVTVNTFAGSTVPWTTPDSGRPCLISFVKFVISHILRLIGLRQTKE
ncbi:hypothetical protein L9F63_005741, partial [Diploptera punctata]